MTITANDFREADLVVQRTRTGQLLRIKDKNAIGGAALSPIEPSEIVRRKQAGEKVVEV